MPTTVPNSQPATTPTIPHDLVWHDLRSWGVEGRGFADTENYFDRLPARAKDVVGQAVWDLSRNTAGMSCRFQTDATSIYIRYELLTDMFWMGHMPATGVCGVDLYGKIEQGWNWLATTRQSSRKVEVLLADGIAPGFREYLLHLPLYNGVESMEIGLPKEASFGPIAPRTSKPIVFYGTSITQGGCASRPGMAFTNILGRRLDVPILNFGFSGNGKMEIEVVRFLSELDPSLFVNDCMANTLLEQVRERVGPMTKLLREAHPTMPILFVEDRVWSDAPLRPERAQQVERKHVLREEFDKLVQAGVEHLHYKTGEDLLGDDNEGTVDGSHPNDLGMMRYADALEPVLRAILG
jgi:lysophospholipase L1-like esterase